MLELSLREALSLGHNYIATEHILLVLARENASVAARILLDFDADPTTIRNTVVRMLPDSISSTHPPPQSPRSVSHDNRSLAADTPLGTGTVVDLGWRGRPIALAALGAAVLTRRALIVRKPGRWSPSRSNCCSNWRSGRLRTLPRNPASYLSHS